MDGREDKQVVSKARAYKLTKKQILYIDKYVCTYNLHKVHGNRTKWVCIVLKSECLKNTWCSLASGGPILITGRDQGDGILGSHWSGVPESWPFIGWEPRGVTPHSSLSSSPSQWSSFALESSAWYPPVLTSQKAHYGPRRVGRSAQTGYKSGSWSMEASWAATPVQ